jgi:hypothetical protein
MRSRRKCAKHCLLIFYFQIRGMPEAEFIARLHALEAKEPKGAKEAPANG